MDVVEEKLAELLEEKKEDLEEEKGRRGSS